jgi:hypothetical protein
MFYRGEAEKMGVPRRATTLRFLRVRRHFHKRSCGTFASLASDPYCGLLCNPRLRTFPLLYPATNNQQPITVFTEPLLRTLPCFHRRPTTADRWLLAPAFTASDPFRGLLSGFVTLRRTSRNLRLRTYPPLYPITNNKRFARAWCDRRVSKG